MIPLRWYIISCLCGCSFKKLHFRYIFISSLAAVILSVHFLYWMIIYHLSDIFCVDKNAEMIWMFCPVWIGGQEMENHLSAHFCSSLNLTTFCSRHRDGRIFFQECAMGKWCRTITHLATKDCNKNFTMPIAYNTFPHSAVELKIYCQIFLGGRHFRSLHSKAI